MKRSFVLIPLIFLVLFLLGPFFVLKGNETGKKLIDPVAKAPVSKVKKSKSGHESIIFKSVDGGQTWQDISQGLPENLQKEGVHRDAVFADESGLYLRAGNAIFHNEPNSETNFWRREFFPGKQRNITSGRNAILAYNFRGQFLQKTNGKSVWTPMYTNFQEQAVRLYKTEDWMYMKYKERQVSTVFETAGGTVIVGSNGSLFKSVNGGKSWKHVQVRGWIFKLIESNGVLLASNSEGIIRSADNGESWEPVIKGGAGVSVEHINGGFAAIVHNTITESNSVYISLDRGKTWNSIAEGLRPLWFNSFIKEMSGTQPPLHISSIKQAGKYLICSRSDGIFRSSDMGKTWQLLLPSIENRGFNLSVSGNVIYAIPDKGC